MTISQNYDDAFLVQVRSTIWYQRGCVFNHAITLWPFPLLRLRGKIWLPVPVHARGNLFNSRTRYLDRLPWGFRHCCYRQPVRYLGVASEVSPKLAR